MNDDTRRRINEDPRRRLGAVGEQLAADHLARRGMKILARNFRTRHGELDIIALDTSAIVFCEVKTRLASVAAGARDPLESVHPRKRAQVRRMAASWLAAADTGRPRASDLRFDAIGVTLDRDGRLLRLDHLEAAF
jgi:putative endonuclease